MRDHNGNDLEIGDYVKFPTTSVEAVVIAFKPPHITIMRLLDEASRRSALMLYENVLPRHIVKLEPEEMI